MTHTAVYKQAASLAPGDLIRYEARTCEVVAPPIPGAQFAWLCHVDLRDIDSGDTIVVTYIASERVLLAEVQP